MTNARIYHTLVALAVLTGAAKPHPRESTTAQAVYDGREQTFYRFVRTLLPKVPPGTRREIRLETPFDSSNGSVSDYSWSVTAGQDETNPPTALEMGGYVRFRADGYIDIFTATRGSALPTTQMDELRKEIARRGSADFSHYSAAYPPNIEMAMADHLQEMRPRVEAIVGHPLGSAPLLTFRSCAPGRAAGVCEPQGTWEAEYATQLRNNTTLHVLLELEPIQGKLL